MASGSGTFESATVGVDSDRFVAFGIKFVNTAGPDNHQAVAFRATGDQTALFNCAFDGAQDTLYVDAGDSTTRTAGSAARWTSFSATRQWLSTAPRSSYTRAPLL
ncbi:hypothetical protein CLOP_g17247 [Closterium sp. NIES-67]|nr:hypothetical protein CLOP_g17247 [Closterium sp. NIES-67]